MATPEPNSNLCGGANTHRKQRKRRLQAIGRSKQLTTALETAERTPVVTGATPSGTGRAGPRGGIRSPLQACRPGGCQESPAKIMNILKGRTSTWQPAAAGRVSRFGIRRRIDRPVPVLAPLVHYLAQALSAFKAVSADACVG